jgi:hypothetical protein
MFKLAFGLHSSKLIKKVVKVILPKYLIATDGEADVKKGILSNSSPLVKH